MKKQQLFAGPWRTCIRYANGKLKTNNGKIFIDDVLLCSRSYLFYITGSLWASGHMY